MKKFKGILLATLILISPTLHSCKELLLGSAEGPSSSANVKKENTFQHYVPYVYDASGDELGVFAGSYYSGGISFFTKKLFLVHIESGSNATFILSSGPQFKENNCEGDLFFRGIKITKTFIRSSINNKLFYIPENAKLEEFVPKSSYNGSQCSQFSEGTLKSWSIKAIENNSEITGFIDAPFNTPFSIKQKLIE